MRISNKKNAWMVFLLVIFLLTEISAQVPFQETGMVSLMNPPNGANWNAPNNSGGGSPSNNRQNLKKAIEWCRHNEKTLYIPSGTYLINDTITIRANDIYWPDQNSSQGGSPVIYGDPDDRPVIKLQDGTFPTVKTPQQAIPVFGLKHVDQTAAWIYFAVLANINFDLGNNPGAAGLAWESAQDSHLRNIKVYGANFAVGIKGFVGRNQGNINLEINNGDYGLYFGAVGVNVTGVKLTGQKEAAVYVKNVRGATIVGLEVEDCSGHGILQKGGGFESAQLYILDASIELTQPSKSAFKTNSRALMAENIFVKGTNKILDAQDNSKDITVNHGNNYTKVTSLALAPATATNRPTYNYYIGAGGKKVNNLTADYNGSGSAPNDLRTKHLPFEQFSFKHPEAKNALTQYSGGTNEQKILNAIASGDRVIYVPAGQYNFSSSIQLGTNKVLIGDPGKRTYFKSDYDPTGYSYIIQTQNTSSGKVVIQDLFFDTQDRPFDGALEWRTGDGFFMNIHNYKGTSYREDNGQVLNKFGHLREYDVRMFTFSGNAGGKFYGFGDHRTLIDPSKSDIPVPASDKFRKVFITGTSNPITFYGLNVERGGAVRNRTQQPFVEVKNSSNIRILGMKSEPDEDTSCEVVRFLNCDNVMASTIFTHRDTEGPIVNVGSGSNASNNIQLGLVATADGATGKLVTSPNDISSGDLLVQYLKGNFQHCVFDGSCGGGGNNPPTADAGPDKPVTLPTSTVTLNGSGTDSDGSITGYSWSQVSGPNTATLSGAGSADLTASGLIAGTYVFELEVTDNDGATDTDQANVTVSTGGSQTAWAVQNIPGKIEGEFYDNGGQGVAYNDTSTGNTGGALRSDDVDVGAKAGASNGHSVGWSASGEWLEYTLAGVTSGTYDLEFSYASGAGGSVGDLRVELDGVLLGTFTNLTSDGNWNNFRTATLTGITVSGGSDKVLRLEYVNGASFDIDAIEFITSGGGGCSAGNKTESAVDAVYTQNGTVFNNNDLRVEQNNRVTYVKFDVDGICTPVTSATLRFDNNDSGNGTFKVFLGSHNSWDDNTSNAGSLPTKGAELASKSGSIGTGQLDFNLSTSAIDNGEITFIVEQTSSGNDIKMSSNNVGNSNDHPKLIIDYGSGAGSRLGTSTLSAADEFGGVIIYPNPSNGHFVVKGITAFKSVSLFNKVGQLMDLETKLTAKGLDISSDGLVKGVYHLMITTEQGSVVRKVIIR